MSLMKSSVHRALRKTLVERVERRGADDEGPPGEELVERILPKKGALTQAKCTDGTTCLLCGSVETPCFPAGTAVFFTHFDGAPVPTLRAVHQVPGLLPRVWVDEGAVRFILSGADIMCPGLNNSRHPLDRTLQPGAFVAVMVDGKETALAIGRMLMSAADIVETNRGQGVENVHYLGDGLWRHSTVS